MEELHRWLRLLNHDTHFPIPSNNYAKEVFLEIVKGKVLTAIGKPCITGTVTALQESPKDFTLPKELQKLPPHV